MAKNERQTQSTAEQLQLALTALIHEAGYDAITIQDKDGLSILRLMRERAAHAIEANLLITFVEADCTMPLGVLANYLAGAQVALVQWWLEKRQPCSPDHLAQTYHRLQRAAICEAFRLGAPAAPAGRPSRQPARGADRSGDARS